MAENTNIGITCEAWAEITVKEWVKKAAMLGISPNHPLTAERFMHHVIVSADGDPRRIEFIYDYYLNFIDWGVGKGVTIENRDAMISSEATHRRQKQWFTSVFYVQLKILAEQLAEKYAKKSALIIKVGIEEHKLDGSKNTN